MTPEWLIALNLVARYGIPAAHQIWTTAKQSAEPTEADWDKLEKLAEKTHDQYIAEAQANAGK